MGLTAYYVTLGIITAVFGGAVLGFVIYLMIKSKKRLKIETTTRVTNYRPKWTHGHYEGWLLESKPTPEGLTRVEFYPTDLNRQEKQKEKMETEIIIAKNVKTIPMGTLSSNVNIMRIFPNTVEELVNKEPYLEFKTNLLNLSENKEMRECLNSLFRKIEHENNKEQINESIKKVNAILGKYPKKKKEIEKYLNELTNVSEKMDSHLSIIQKIREIFTKISTTDLFSHMILKEDLSFNFGKSFKKAYDASMGTVNDINFGALAQLKRKEMEQEKKDWMNYFLRQREEKKIE